MSSPSGTDQASAVVIIILWSAPAALALSLWFIIRFVKHHDSFKESMSEEVKNLALAVADATKAVQKSVMTVHNEAALIQKSFVEFQARVNADLLSIERKSVQIEGQMEQTRMKSKDFTDSIEGLSEGLLKFTQMVREVGDKADANRKTIAIAARVAEKHETEIVRLNDEVVLLKSKKTQ